MLLNWCCSLNIFNAGKLVGGHVKKSATSPLFNRITFCLIVRCSTFQQIHLYNFHLKFQAVAGKTAKNFRGLLYFAAPCSCSCSCSFFFFLGITIYRSVLAHMRVLLQECCMNAVINRIRVVLIRLTSEFVEVTNAQLWLFTVDIAVTRA